LVVLIVNSSRPTPWCSNHAATLVIHSYFIRPWYR